MGKDGRRDRIDPHWAGDDDEGRHPVSELVSSTQGALSPYGDLTFPLPVEELGYEHPVTIINKQ